MIRSLTAAVLAAAVLTGCAADTPPGVVVDAGRRWVEVREDGSGKVVRHRTTKSQARACDPGERWPGC